MKSDHLQETADLVTFIEEILNGKLHFLCGVKSVPRNYSSDILEKILEILTKFLQLSSQTSVFSSTCKSVNMNSSNVTFHGYFQTATECCHQILDYFNQGPSLIGA